MTRARWMIGTAAALAACVVLWTTVWHGLFGGGTSLSFADVQQAVADHRWVCIRYDDNSKRWIDLVDGLTYATREDSSNFYAGVRDHRRGIARYYHSNWGSLIHEDRFDPRPHPKTAWEYAVGDWDDWGRDEDVTEIIEKHHEKQDGRSVVRFDTYRTGPLKLRALVEQVWADPLTRLPLRIRKFLSPNSRRQGRATKEGVFEFPDTGPSSIFDLGAPTGLKVVSGIQGVEGEALEIIKAGRRALEAFPPNLRIVRAGTTIARVYHRFENRSRTDVYRLVDKDRVLRPEIPITAKRVLRWTQQHCELFSTEIFDGAFEFTKPPDGVLYVQRYPSDWAARTTAIKYQWPYVHMTGPIVVLRDGPDVLPDCILLRRDDQGLRMDFHVDPAHDYICVKRVHYQQRDGRWVKQDHSDAKALENLAQLPSGQWYARKVRNFCSTTHVTVDVLDADDFAPELFDGESLLKRAIEEGEKVEF